MPSETPNAADELEKLERAYLESLQALDLDAFMAHYHDDLLGWPSGQTELVDKTALRQAEATEMAAIKPGSMVINVETMGVKVCGETGIIYCKLDYSAVMNDGALINVHQRYAHTWLRTENGWKIFGGMSAPLPAHL